MNSNFIFYECCRIKKSFQKYIDKFKEIEKTYLKQFFTNFCYLKSCVFNQIDM